MRPIVSYTHATLDDDESKHQKSPLPCSPHQPLKLYPIYFVLNYIEIKMYFTLEI